MPLKILSIKQPYAALIALGIKDIENRTWNTNHRGPLLIHAGKQFDHEGYAEVLGKMDPIEAAAFPGKDAFPLGGIVGIVRVTDVVKEHPSKWFQGPLGWTLEKGRPLPFMEMLGKLGLFDAPPEIEAQVRAFLQAQRTH